ncbi:hypothetical protein SALBM135S_10086 [Streptomyces alboniger]
MASEISGGGQERTPGGTPDGTRTGEGTVRVDAWIWSVRLVKTRSAGAAACKGGHVRVNGERVKPAYGVRRRRRIVRVRRSGPPRAGGRSR